LCCSASFFATAVPVGLNLRLLASNFTNFGIMPISENDISVSDSENLASFKQETLLLTRAGGEVYR
jgi:hypothetical protein